MKIVAALLAVVAVLLTVKGVLIWRSKDTPRESFSATVLAAYTTLVGSVVTNLIGGEPFWQALLQVGAKFLKLDYVPSSAAGIDKVLAVVVLSMGLLVIDRLDTRWRGPKSTAHRLREQNGERSGLIREGLEEARRRLRGEPPPQIEEQTTKIETKPIVTGTELSWSRQARDLLCSKNRNLQFSDSDSWDEGCEFWVGTNKLTNDSVFLKCFSEEPQAAQLKKFVAEARLVVTAKKLKSRMTLIAAVQSSVSTRSKTIDRADISLVTEESLLEDLVDFSEYFAHINDPPPLPWTPLSARRCARRVRWQSGSEGRSVRISRQKRFVSATLGIAPSAKLHKILISPSRGCERG